MSQRGLKNNCNTNMEKPSKNRLQKTPNECVQVVVRSRPMSEKEKIDGHNVVSVYPMRGAIELVNINTDPNKENRKLFTYDAVYDLNSTQKNIYDEVVRPLVSSVLEGFNCCVFAYGQTGTGKTHTMEGIANDMENMGIIPRTFEQIWSSINRTQNTNFLVAVSYLEIYMEELRDLLRPKKKNLELREREKSGVYVPNLHSVSCQSVDDMKIVMNQGNKNRTVGYTNMNEHSSRSHAIFMIKIEMCEEESNTIKVGKLNLIDLAGSERQHKTGATAERLKEASKINLALSSLGNVISALSENSPHIPYRDSKLTRLLQDSLGGNSKTIMIANIGPSSFNYNETLTTLRYASRAKTIQNKPIKNEDPQDAQLREYQEEIERLRKLISDRQKTEKTFNNVKRVKSNKVNKNNEIENNEIENDENIEPSDEIAIESTISVDTESLKRERDITVQLAVQLQELEGQLVKGGKNILDTYTERQMELEKRLVEIAERKKREVEIQQQLELQEETTLEIRDTVTSLEQEVDLKTKKLSKCYAKYLALQQELSDTKNEHNYDLRELEVTQNELVKELKRLLLIIDNFVPVEIKNRLYTQARYDEEEEEWKISPTMLNDVTIKRPISCPNRRRPMSEYSIQEAKRNTSNAYRHHGENIVNYELDMPCRTTYEYRRPKISASLQAVLAEAMQTDDDIDIIDSSGATQTKLDRILNTNSQQYSGGGGGGGIVGGGGVGGGTTNVRNINSSTPEGRSHHGIKKPVSAYPKSRGLVKK